VGAIKKYQAASPLSTAVMIPGHKPTRYVVRITAGKKVKKGKPGGSIPSTRNLKPKATTKATRPKICPNAIWFLLSEKSVKRLIILPLLVLSGNYLA
jgi:hypothetical protein